MRRAIVRAGLAASYLVVIPLFVLMPFDALFSTPTALPVAMAILFVTLVLAQFVAYSYLLRTRCPVCGAHFARQKSIHWIQPPPEAFTRSCQNCGARIPRLFGNA